MLVLDRRNHHLFQPLLYQVATAALSPANIAEPIRSVLRSQRNTRVRLDEAMSIDVTRRQVRTAAGHTFGYDYLVVAAGARTNFFGHEDDWPSHAPGLKSLDDAIEIRERFLSRFELADSASSDEERRRLLSFVVIGAGPTGVELAGTISEVARKSVPPDFANIAADDVSVTLVQGGEHVLDAYPVELQRRAERDLRELGVDVITGDLAASIDDDGVTLRSGRRLNAGAMFWGAGVTPSPLSEQLGANRDDANRVFVSDDLSLPAHPEVFVVGDLARVDDRKTGEPVPGVAAAAIQMGSFVGKTIKGELSRHAAPTRSSDANGDAPARRAFRYFDKGMLATIGRGRAVGVIRGRRLSGPIAWLAWLVVHIVYLVGFRNRLIVLVQWAYAYIFYIRGARLITGRSESAMPHLKGRSEAHESSARESATQRQTSPERITTSTS